MLGGQLYLGASDATTNDSFRLYAASGQFVIASRESGTWTTRFDISDSGSATFTGTVTATHFYGDGSNLTNISAAAPSNMVTTDTSQTISGAKTFSHTDGVKIQRASNTGNAIRLLTENDGTQIADDFSANTSKSYMYFDLSLIHI